MFSAGRSFCVGLVLGIVFFTGAFCIAAPPSVTITNIVVGSNNVLTIHAAASDSDGTVTNVEFYAAVVIGGTWTKIGEANSNPYRLAWPSAGERYNINAVATDNSGLRSTSIMWQVSAWLPPQISISSPAPNSVFSSGTPIPFITTITSERPVQSVRFYFGPATTTVSNAPWSGTWLNPPAGRWSVVAQVFDEAQYGQSSPLPITVLPADGSPFVVSEPSSITLAPGQTATFTADAQAFAAPVRYQWRHFGTNLLGETNSSLIIPNVQPAHAGSYSALITSDAAAVSTLTAWLTLIGPGVSVMFSGGQIYAPFGGGLMGTSYRAELWAGPSPYQLAQIGGAVTMFNGNFNGGTRTVTTVSAPNSVYCQVRFRLASGEPVVNSSLLAYPTPSTSLSNLFVPGYSEWPDPNFYQPFGGGSETIAPVNAGFRLTNSAYTHYLTTYQWHKDGVAVGPPLVVTNTAFWWTFTEIPMVFASLQLDDAASYTLLGSNSININVSAPKKLTVVKRSLILQAPISRTVLAGTNVEVSVVAGGEAPLRYQWRRQGTDLPGATNTSVVLAPIGPGDGGAYQVVVQNNFGAVTSQVAQITVISAPVLTNQPLSRTLVAGSNVTLQVGALGPDLEYQWRFGGSDLAGKTNATLALSNIQPADEGAYTVRVSNQYGAVTCAVATITVIASPILLGGPTNAVLYVGMNHTLATSVTGAPPLSFQWFQDGNLLGSTTASLQLSNVQPGDAGQYLVIVSNGWGSATGTAQVVMRSEPVITNYSYSVYHDVAGGGRGFLSKAFGAPPLTLQWYKNGIPLSGATNASINISLAISNSGTYSLAARNPLGVVSNLIFTEVVYAAPRIVAAPGPMAPKGSAVTFSADVHGPVAYVYWWNFGVATYSTNYTVQNVHPPAAHSPTLYVNYGSPMFGTVRSVPSLSVTVGSTLLLSAPTAGGNGDVTFKILSGTVATQIEVQSSEELTTWAPVATVTATNGVATYVHQATSNQLSRFFRAVASP